MVDQYGLKVLHEWLDTTNESMHKHKYIYIYKYVYVSMDQTFHSKLAKLEKT